MTSRADKTIQRKLAKERKMGEPRFLSFEEWLARNPAEKTRLRRCAACDGTGRITKSHEPAKRFPCQVCRGRGKGAFPYITYEEQKAADREKWERFCGNRTAGGVS